MWLESIGWTFLGKVRYWAPLKRNSNTFTLLCALHKAVFLNPYHLRSEGTISAKTPSQPEPASHNWSFCTIQRPRQGGKGSPSRSSRGEAEHRGNPVGSFLSSGDNKRLHRSKLQNVFPTLDLNMNPAGMRGCLRNFLFSDNFDSSSDRKIVQKNTCMPFLLV